MTEITRHLSVGLAEVFVRGPWNPTKLAANIRAVLINSRSKKWVTGLTRRVVRAFPGNAPPRAAILVKYLEQDEILYLICDSCLSNEFPLPEINLKRLPRRVMQPSAGAASSWNVRPLVTVDEVAQWLELTHAELDWFTAQRRHSSDRDVEQLRHYRYRWIAKTSGGRRLLEIPKPRLKMIQRKILVRSSIKFHRTQPLMRIVTADQSPVMSHLTRTSESFS